MKYRESLLIICLLACVLLAIGSVSASDVNETTIANDGGQQVIEQTSDDIDLSSSSKDDLISNENTSVVAQSRDENTLSASSDSDVLAVSSSDDVVKSSSTTNSKKTTKSDLSISAPKVTKVYKKNGVFKVTVKDKNTKKPVKGITLKIKVYTGNKYKTFKAKTNKNGIAKISTKSLSKGTHKVVVNAKATKKYKAKTVKSSIKIKSKSSSINNNGKVSTRIKAKYTLTWKSKEYVHSYSYGTYSTYVKYPYISINPTLEGADGKKISGEYEAIVYYYTGDDNKLLRTDTFKGKYGEWKYYSGTPGGSHYKVVINYNGNSKYAATTFSAYN